MNILFPFYYDSRHGFLISEWWFRALIVIYISIFILSIGVSWYDRVSYIHRQCLERIEYPRIPSNYAGGIAAYFKSPESKIAQAEIERLKEDCDLMTQKSWFASDVLKNAFLIPLLIHYILQFILFTITIDFIVLGNKKG